MEDLEPRQMLTGDGIELPVLSVQAPELFELMSTSDGQISQAVAADFNQDGRLDYAATVSGQSRRVFFFIDDAEGGYVGTEMPNVSDNYFEDIAVGDFNGDGWMDAIAAAEKTAYVYLNTGDVGGSWEGMQSSSSVRLAVRSLSVADMNDDGRDDVAFGTAERVEVRFADSQGRFQSGIWYLNDSTAKTVTTGDVNGDDAPDLIAASDSDTSIEVLLNDGDGFLAEHQTIQTSEPIGTVALLDVTGDSLPDLVAGGRNQYNPNVFLFPAGQDGNFQPSNASFETVGAPRDFALADINHDALPDLIVSHSGTFHHPITNNGPGGISVLTGTPAGTFQDPIRVTTPGTHAMNVVQTESGPVVEGISQFGNERIRFSLDEQSLVTNAHDYAEPAQNMFQYRVSAMGDFNNDGLLDAVVANRFNQNVGASLYLANGTDTFDVTPLSITPLTRINEFFVGDFNGDGVDDLGLQSDARYYGMISNGDGTFAAPRMGTLPESFGNYQVLDLNNDGRDDLIGTEGTPTQTWVVYALADASGRWTASEDRLLLKDRFVSEMLLLDLNGDNALDLVSSSFQGVETAFGRSDGGFDASVKLPLESNFYTAGDVNGDGWGDVIASNFGELAISIAYGSESGEYTVVENVGTDVVLTNTQGLTAIDVDADGTVELAVTTIDGFYLLSLDNDQFVSQGYTLGFFPDRYDLQDVTGDGLRDIVASPGMNFIGGSPTTQIAILAGNGTKDFAQPSVAAASFIDGQLAQISTTASGTEFFISHRLGFGKMSRRSASGDFDGNGQIDAADIDLLCAATHAIDPPQEDIARFDQNDDDQLSAEDVDIWLADVANTRRGDADLDGDVDFADFLSLAGNFGSDAGSWSQGDFDCDGEVSFSDFLLLAGNFGIDNG